MAETRFVIRTEQQYTGDVGQQRAIRALIALAQQAGRAGVSIEKSLGGTEAAAKRSQSQVNALSQSLSGLAQNTAIQALERDLRRVRDLDPFGPNANKIRLQAQAADELAAALRRVGQAGEEARARNATFGIGGRAISDSQGRAVQAIEAQQAGTGSRSAARSAVEGFLATGGSVDAARQLFEAIVDTSNRSAARIQGEWNRAGKQLQEAVGTGARGAVQAIVPLTSSLDRLNADLVKIRDIDPFGPNSDRIRAQRQAADELAAALRRAGQEGERARASNAAFGVGGGAISTSRSAALQAIEAQQAGTGSRAAARIAIESFVRAGGSGAEAKRLFESVVENSNRAARRIQNEWQKSGRSVESSFGALEGAVRRFSGLGVFSGFTQQSLRVVIGLDLIAAGWRRVRKEKELAERPSSPFAAAGSQGSAGGGVTSGLLARVGGGGIGRLAATAGAAGIGALGVTLGAVGFGAAGAGYAGYQAIQAYQPEREAQLVLEALTKNAKGAEEAISRLRAQSRQSSTAEFDALAEGAKLAAVYRIQLEQIPRLVAAASAKSIGDAQRQQSIILAIGQINQRGLVQGNEIRQLSEAGVAATSILSNALGQTVPEFIKNVEQGRIPARAAVALLINDMEAEAKELDKKVGQSFSGTMRRLKNDVTGEIASIGKQLEPFGVQVLLFGEQLAKGILLPFQAAKAAIASFQLPAIPLVGPAQQRLDSIDNQIRFAPDQKRKDELRRQREAVAAQLEEARKGQAALVKQAQDEANTLLLPKPIPGVLSDQARTGPQAEAASLSRQALAERDFRQEVKNFAGGGKEDSNAAAAASRRATALDGLLDLEARYGREIERNQRLLQRYQQALQAPGLDNNYRQPEIDQIQEIRDRIKDEINSRDKAREALTKQEEARRRQIITAKGESEIRVQRARQEVELLNAVVALEAESLQNEQRARQIRISNEEGQSRNRIRQRAINSTDSDQTARFAFEENVRQATATATLEFQTAKEITDQGERQLAIEQIRLSLKQKIADLALTEQERTKALSLELQRQTIELSRQQISQGANTRVRELELQSRPGNQEQVAAQAMRVRLQAATEVYNLELRRIATLESAQQRELETARARQTLQEQLDDARLRNAERIRELQEEEVSRVRDIIGRIAANGDLGGELRAAARSQIVSIAQNLGEEVYRNSNIRGGLTVPGQQNADGSLNFFGRALRGTVYGVSPADLAQDANTRAVGDLTTAVQQNTQVLSGTGSGRIGAGTVGGGINLGRIFGGATGTPGIFNLSGSSSTIPGLGYDFRKLPTLPSDIQKLTGIGGGGQNPGFLARNSGTFAGLGLGAASIIGGSRQGGLGGALGVAGGVAQSVAAIGKFIGLAKFVPGLQFAAPLLQFLPALLPNNRQRRDDQIARDIEARRRNTGPFESRTEDIVGRSIDTDFSGTARVYNTTNNFTTNIQTIDQNGIVELIPRLLPPLATEIRTRDSELVEAVTFRQNNG